MGSVQRLDVVAFLKPFNGFLAVGWGHGSAIEHLLGLQMVPDSIHGFSRKKKGKDQVIGLFQCELTVLSLVDPTVSIHIRPLPVFKFELGIFILFTYFIYRLVFLSEVQGRLQNLAVQ